MELLLKTPPAQEPLTIEEVRSYLRLSVEQDGGSATLLVASARAHVETITGRALLKQKWQLNLKPPYPLSSPLVQRRAKNLLISLPKPPLLSVEAITFKEEAIPFEQEGNRLILSPRFWDKAICITYWAGYGETADSLPPDLKMAVLMATRFFYDQQPMDLALLKPYKVFHVV